MQMVQTFKRWNMDATFVTEFDKPELSHSFLECFVFPRDNDHMHRVLSQYTLKAGELSLATKNFWVYYQILMNNSTNALVVEDDIVLQIDLEANPHSCREVDVNETTAQDKGNVNLNRLMREITDIVPSNYAVLQLGSCIHNKERYFNEALLGEMGIRKRVVDASLGDSHHW
jgi:hypothetical protein